MNIKNINSNMVIWKYLDIKRVFYSLEDSFVIVCLF